MRSILAIACDTCEHTWLASGLGVERTLERLGWRRMPKGFLGEEADWRCPDCTGITGPLKEVHARVVNGKAVVDEPLCPLCEHPSDHHEHGFCPDGPCPCYLA